VKFSKHKKRKTYEPVILSGKPTSPAVWRFIPPCSWTTSAFSGQPSGNKVVIREQSDVHALVCKCLDFQQACPGILHTETYAFDVKTSFAVTQFIIRLNTIKYEKQASHHRFILHPFDITGFLPFCKRNIAGG
jgi:hypothetical protein